MTKRIYPYIPYCLDIEKIGEELFLMQIEEGEPESIRFEEIYAEITKTKEISILEASKKEILDGFYWTLIVDGKKYKFKLLEHDKNFPFFNLIIQIYQKIKPQCSPFEGGRFPTLYLAKQYPGFYHFFVCDGLELILDDVCLALREEDLNCFERDISRKFPYDFLEKENEFFNEEEEALSNLVYRKYFTETKNGQLIRESELIERINTNFPFSRRHKAAIKQFLKYNDSPDSILQTILLTLIYSKQNHIFLILTGILILLLFVTVVVIIT